MLGIKVMKIKLMTKSVLVFLMVKNYFCYKNKELKIFEILQDGGWLFRIPQAKVRFLMINKYQNFLRLKFNKISKLNVILQFSFLWSFISTPDFYICQPQFDIDKFNFLAHPGT